MYISFLIFGNEKKNICRTVIRYLFIFLSLSLSLLFIIVVVIIIIFSPFQIAVGIPKLNGDRIAGCLSFARRIPFVEKLKWEEGIETERW